MKYRFKEGNFDSIDQTSQEGVGANIENSAEQEPLPVVVGEDGTIYLRQEGDENVEGEPTAVTAYADMLSEVSGKTGVAFDQFPKSAKAGMLAMALAATVSAGAALAPTDAHAYGPEFQAFVNQPTAIVQDPTLRSQIPLKQSAQIQMYEMQRAQAYAQAQLQAAQWREAARLQAAQFQAQAHLRAAQYGAQPVVGYGSAYPNTVIQGGVSIQGRGGSFVMNGMIRR